MCRLIFFNKPLEKLQSSDVAENLANTNIVTVVYLFIHCQLLIFLYFN